MAYRAAGIDLPRTAAEQSRVGIPVSGPGQLRPGDLLFVPGSDGTASEPGHVGMYVGGGLVLDAPHTGLSVHLSAMSSYWAGAVVIRRVVG
jgi:cell wall-associated NlpC family hydrolase